MDPWLPGFRPRLGVFLEPDGINELLLDVATGVWSPLPRPLVAWWPILIEPSVLLLLLLVLFVAVVTVEEFDGKF